MEYTIFGQMACTPESTQEISKHDGLQEALEKCNDLNDNPKNHPDLYFWVEDQDGQVMEDD